MGHYAAEMSCSQCGHLRCTCPPTPAPINSDWAIHGLKVVPADQLDPFERLAAGEAYVTREAAEAVLPGVIQKCIDQQEAQLRDLRRALKVAQATVEHNLERKS